MNYSLSSKRPCTSNGYVQRITTFYPDAPEGSAGSTMSTMQGFHTLMEGFDTGKTFGTIKYDAMQTCPNEGTGNTATKLDAVLTFRYQGSGSGKPDLFQVCIINCLKTGFVATVTTEIGKIVNENPVTSNLFIESAILTLHD